MLGTLGRWFTPQLIRRHGGGGLLFPQAAASAPALCRRAKHGDKGSRAGGGGQGSNGGGGAAQQDYPSVVVPKNGVRFSFTRAGGPGGQHVNKVSTRATLRFHVDSAAWLPPEVRRRLRQNEPARIGKDGEFQLSSAVHRTQPRNIADCMQRLQQIVDAACVAPKERKAWEGIGDKTKEHRKISKRRRSGVKKSRQKNRAEFF